ncbi:hypothetical protein [Xylophilus sp.]|uniref:hypothetical protein n=1 Tax=Xylophilus sp. TaxID=2653893 RepID=UPI0013B74367|nr:hypothetical protein [Xylophilus sp.]KAF1045253.1 MAG: hypothetical protein GAK38_03091 [Xylophilus sp.]
MEPQVAGGRIAVRARADAGGVVVEVIDAGAGLDDAAAALPAARFGLTQIRERLAAVYGGAAMLVLAFNTSEGTVATLRLPLDAPPA